MDLYAKALSYYQSGNSVMAANLCRTLLAKSPNHPETLNLLAAVEYAQGNAAEAVKLTEKLLKKAIGYAGGYANLSLYLRAVGKYDDALKAANRAASIDPKLVDAYVQQALTLTAMQRYEEAISAHEKELAHAPSPLAQLRYGDTEFARGEYANAASRYEMALQQAPDLAEAKHNLAMTMLRLENPAEALLLTAEILSRANVPQTHVLRGSILQQLQQPQEAIAHYRAALAIAPHLFDAHNNLAGVLQTLGMHTEARPHAEQAVQLRPQSAEALVQLGNIEAHAGAFASAQKRYEAALDIAPHLYQALGALGALHQRAGNIAAAEEVYAQALLRAPDAPDLHANLGWLRHTQGNYAAAVASYDTALQIDPSHAGARFNKAVYRLLHGDFIGGWLLYESRWQKQDQATPRAFAQPRWRGETLEGKTILLHAEQGLGDTIQFCRYAAEVAEKKGRVVLEVQPALQRLLTTLDAPVQLVARGDALPPFDVECPLMSLPGILGTRLETIPGAVPYLRATAVTLPASGKKRVGLVWSGTATHANDSSRSLPLAALTPLLAMDVEFHVLQKDVRESDRITMEVHGITTHALGDMADTAALVKAMDLVISVDTSVAHLAGALAVPVWILLPFSPDFRWLLERSDSPWYPTARLFRQPAIGDWQTVIEQVASALVTEGYV